MPSHLRKVKRENGREIDIPLIRSFITHIELMALTLLLISAAGFLVMRNNESVRVIYIVVICINFVVITVSYTAIRFLREK